MPLAKAVNWLKHNHLYVLLVILFSCAFINVRYYFLSDWSYVAGRIVEYRYPTLFLTDLVGSSLIVAYLFKRKNREVFFSRLRSFFYSWGIPAFLFFVLASFLPPIDGLWYFVLRFGFYTCILFVLVDLVSRRTFNDIIEKNLKLILLGVTLLYLLQFVPFLIYYFDTACDFCTKIGGINYLVQKLGVSHVTLLGRIYPRNYGFFPHPNILGGFVAIITTTLLYYVQKNTPIKSSIEKLFLGIYLGVAALVLLSTFSVTATIALLGGLVILATRLKTPLYRILCLFGIFLLLSISVYLLALKDETHISLRIELLKIAADLLRQSPLYGVGPLEFTKYIPKYGLSDANGLLFLQPVHNVFALILSEFGLILGGFGLFKFAALLYSRFQQNGVSLLAIILPFLTILMLDHYLFTLNQGILLSLFFLVTISSNFKQKH